MFIQKYVDFGKKLTSSALIVGALGPVLIVFVFPLMVFLILWGTVVMIITMLYHLVKNLMGFFIEALIDVWS